MQSWYHYKKLARNFWRRLAIAGCNAGAPLQVPEDEFGRYLASLLRHQIIGMLEEPCMVQGNDNNTNADADANANVPRAGDINRIWPVWLLQIRQR